MIGRWVTWRALMMVSLHPAEDVRAAKRRIARVLPDDQDMAARLPIWTELEVELARQAAPTGPAGCPHC